MGHVSYMILVIDGVRGRCWGLDLFSSAMFSLFCHGYCAIAHMHSVGWSIGLKHRGACL